jgi:hypothetical protein
VWVRFLLVLYAFGVGFVGLMSEKKKKEKDKYDVYDLAMDSIHPNSVTSSTSIMSHAL